jgi:hypothetical protein
MNKPKRNRTPAHRVNRRQKALAIKALTAIVESPDAAEYVRGRAAAALLNNGKDAPESDVPLRDPAVPRAIIFLPDNHRNRRSLVPLGPQGGSSPVIYDSSTPEGLADYARWRAEAVAAGHTIIAPQ